MHTPTIIIISKNSCSSAFLSASDAVVAKRIDANSVFISYYAPSGGGTAQWHMIVNLGAALRLLYDHQITRFAHILKLLVTTFLTDDYACMS